MAADNTSSPLGNMSVDPSALWSDIMASAQFGATRKGGIKRLTLTQEDSQVRQWFADTCTSLGATVSTDTMGNQFARVAGTEPGFPPIVLGSHLDTQPTGGKFDGIIGVLGGIAVLRALRETGHKTRHPIEVANWTNEEGSRFAPAMLSSGVFAGLFTEDYARSRLDREGVSFGQALDASGQIGKEVCGQHPIGAYLELHIEQGPILETEEKTIGIVTGVQGMRWYDVTVTGRDSHAGTTPMGMRIDALQGAARLIAAVQQIALTAGPDCVGTVGTVDVRPNSRNVVPGEVYFTVDFRDPNDATVLAMEKRLRVEIAQLERETGLTVVLNEVWDSPAVHFNDRLVTAVTDAASALALPARRIVSGAGHDAAYIARVAPTAMIFVPCAGGLSHNEEESATQPDVAAGANVLLHAMLAADAF